MLDKNNPLMDYLFKSHVNKYLSKIQTRLDLARKLLRSLPDFSMDLSYEIVSSVIPFLSSILPSDTIKLVKQGTSIRIDFKNIKLSGKAPEESAVEDNPFKKNFSTILREGKNLGGVKDGHIDLLFLDWDRR